MPRDARLVRDYLIARRYVQERLAWEWVRDRLRFDLAVSRDALASGAVESSASPMDFTNLTIGAISNGALIVQLVFDVAEPAATVTWDFGASAQTVTLISKQYLAGAREAHLWGLVNPIAGNKTLRVTWTTAGRVIVFATSYQNVNQAGGATSFPAATPTTGTSVTVSIAIPSAVGNMTVDCFGSSGAGPTPTQTQLFYLSGAGAVDGGSSEAAGSASNTHQWSQGSAAWAAVGTDIVAFGGAAKRWILGTH